MSSHEIGKKGSGGETSVLIVGAGPTGLLLASELARRDVPFHLIDSRSAPMHWDRATVVHSRSLQIFESLGLGQKFLDAGCRQRVIKIHSNGKLLGKMELSNCGSSYGFNVGLSEEVTESILTEYLEQLGSTVNRGPRLVGLTQQNGGVLAEIECDGERYRVNARWVVGCDGFHSPTREMSGIEFGGHDILKPWAVFDATIAGWTDTYEGNFAYFGEHPTIFTALPGHRWRVYLRPSSAESDLVEDANAVLRVYAPGASFVDVENPTRFHCATKIAKQYRSGPVFLAGDAAHLCSPAQGHGMNCGLQDAFNLAWKMALVYQGDADPALLDSYEAERRPAAELVAQSGDEFENALTMTDPAKCAARDQAIRAMIADPTARQHEIVAETELNVVYSGSPILVGDGAGDSLIAGRCLPDQIEVRGPDGRECRLHELAHRAGHTLMMLSGVDAKASETREMHAALQKLVAGSRVFEAAVSLGSSGDLLPEIGYLEPAAAELLGVKGTMLLAVRPDGYIGLRADRDHLRALERYRTLVHAGHA